jgi:hypothetical protein
VTEVVESPAARTGDEAAPVTPVAQHERLWVVLVACATAYLPFTLLGYGTDIDVPNVLRAGRTWLDEGVYELSRKPGAVVHEVATAALDRVGGSVLVNLASVAFALLAIWSVYRLVRADGSAFPGWASLAMAANPWFWLAATSLGDFMWALGLALGGAFAASRDRRWLAGVMFGLAIGCRMSTVLMVIAWLVAERTGTRSGRVDWSATLRTGGVAVAVAVACFVPPWLQNDRSLDFLDTGLAFAGWGLNAGRWAVKNAAVIGIPAGFVMLVGVPRVLGALARWRVSTVVRFAVLTTVMSEVLFFRLPLKPVHLLPVVAAVALMAGASPRVSRTLLMFLVGAQLVGGIVGTTIGAPDVAHDATTGRLDIQLTEGPLLNMVECRLDDRELGPWPDPTDGPEEADAAFDRATANFDCQSETWRAAPESDAPSALGVAGGDR